MTERLKHIDVARIFDLWKEYAAACRAGNIERYLALWTEDGRQMAPDASQRIGKEQIRAAMQSLFDLIDIVNMVINTEVVRVLGNWAYSHGTHTFNITTKDGGRTLSLSGKFLSILQRQRDGSWRVAIECRNYNEPDSSAFPMGARGYL
jgi:uncharacterized protein (TIGR02246 family)